MKGTVGQASLLLPGGSGGTGGGASDILMGGTPRCWPCVGGTGQALQGVLGPLVAIPVLLLVFLGLVIGRQGTPPPLPALGDRPLGTGDPWHVTGQRSNSTRLSPPSFLTDN